MQYISAWRQSPKRKAKADSTTASPTLPNSQNTKHQRHIPDRDDIKKTKSMMSSPPRSVSTLEQQAREQQQPKDEIDYGACDGRSSIRSHRSSTASPLTPTPKSAPTQGLVLGGVESPTPRPITPTTRSVYPAQEDEDDEEDAEGLDDEERGVEARNNLEEQGRGNEYNETPLPSPESPTPKSKSQPRPQDPPNPASIHQTPENDQDAPAPTPNDSLIPKHHSLSASAPPLPLVPLLLSTNPSTSLLHSSPLPTPPPQLRSLARTSKRFSTGTIGFADSATAAAVSSPAYRRGSTASLSWSNPSTPVFGSGVGAQLPRMMGHAGTAGQVYHGQGAGLAGGSGGGRGGGTTVSASGGCCGNCGAMVLSGGGAVGTGDGNGPGVDFLARLERDIARLETLVEKSVGAERVREANVERVLGMVVGCVERIGVLEGRVEEMLKKRKGEEKRMGNRGVGIDEGELRREEEERPRVVEMEMWDKRKGVDEAGNSKPAAKSLREVVGCGHEVKRPPRKVGRRIVGYVYEAEGEEKSGGAKKGRERKGGRG